MFAVAVLLAIVALPAWAAAPPERAKPSDLKPKLQRDHVAYGGERKDQMASYSKRHYGEREWRLERPKVIVLHYTAGPSYSSAWNAFDSNAPNLGERPGVCAHYMVDKDGTIGELVQPRIRCRHTIGLNHRAIGIEMVQEAGSGSHWADQQILDRKKQITPALRLVRWLQAKFGIRTTDVIGHSMANGHRLFEDRQGWRNDHSDWLKRDVKEFRRKLKRLG